MFRSIGFLSSDVKEEAKRVPEKGENDVAMKRSKPLTKLVERTK